jgi:hypothetical protein
MRKLREVLRLQFERYLGYQQIERSCAIWVSTVCKYLKRAEAAGVTWPLPEGWDDARVEAALFLRTAARRKSALRQYRLLCEFESRNYLVVHCFAGWLFLQNRLADQYRNIMLQHRRDFLLLSFECVFDLAYACTFFA